MFLQNCWYVAAWSHELDAEKPISRTIIGSPIAFYRRSDGAAVALEDRCPHRHAPLSLGRIEGDDLRCMYHGLKFGCDGVCKEVPGSQVIPPNSTARVYPVVEQSSWIWVWMGDPARANPETVPTAVGLDNPEWVMRSGALDYEADYQLINDNLCDLSHLDFVHETSLGAATGLSWSRDQPKVTALDNGLLIERWFVNGALPPKGEIRFDSWSSYRFLLPGLFLMNSLAFPVGTAERNGFGPPVEGTPFVRRTEQQAVTPIDDGRARYLYATGLEAKTMQSPELIEQRFSVVNAAFAEDKRMIEGQQKIWNLTSPDKQKAFIPQDKAPAIMRRLIARLIAAEQEA